MGLGGGWVGLCGVGCVSFLMVRLKPWEGRRVGESTWKETL